MPTIRLSLSGTPWTWLLPAKFASRTCARSFASKPIGNDSKRNEFDYVIVGAGSAGCVLTHRLSAAGNNVCLLEAGPTDNDDSIQIPMRWAELFYNKTYNWNYWTTPQAELGNRRMYWPRGKALGGTSSVNTMVFMRPNPLDLDRWAFKENAYGWSFAETLPYFKRLETYHASDDYPKEQLHVYRGFDGPMHVMSGKLRNETYGQLALYDAFLRAGEQAGLGYTHDANGFRQEGVCWFDSTTYRGERMSTSATYLKEALTLHPNRVHIETGALCTKLLFDGSKKRVIGVETATAPTTRRQFYARKDVIVSGGAINSAQLLQLSGIGNADHLRQVGIEAVLHLPGVGENLQDHIRLVVGYECKPLGTNRLGDAKYAAAAQEEWKTHKRGLATSSGLEVGAHIRTSQAFDHPNVQVHFVDRFFEDCPDVALKLLQSPAILMSAATQREFSRGYVRLASANPFDYASIDPRVLTDSRDVAELVDAVKVCRRVFQQKAFDEFRKGELIPGPSVNTDEEIEQYVRTGSITAYHPCGTCKMGDISKDPNAVVDPLNMRVHGLDGLRVVDASVMPSEPSCNLNAPTLMIAEKASDLILGNKLLAPENAPFYQTV